MEYVKQKAKKPLNPRKNYDFGSMAVFEHFTFPIEEINRIKSAAYTYGSRHGKKFSVWKNDVTGKTGHCQRTA